jgi:hypothetical protein
VHVAVGPVDAGSAKAWITWARELVAGLPARDGTVSEDLQAAFATYLDEWSAIAEAGATFRWETEAEPELVEYLVHGFYRLAGVITEEAERRGRRFSPPEGDAFYTALVNALLDALGEESAANAEFAGHLRAFWPGITPETR